MALITNQLKANSSFKSSSNSLLGFLSRHAASHSQQSAEAALRSCAEGKQVSLGHGSWKHRSKHTQATTFSGLGILVPYDDKQDVGYRYLMRALQWAMV